MANILTDDEAAAVLRVEADNPDMTGLLDLVDNYIKAATGRDWTTDTPIHPGAKAAARMLLVMWFENPAMTGQPGALDFGLRAMLTQLEAEALKYRKVTFYGLNGSGYITALDAQLGDNVLSVTGVYGVSGNQASKFETVISQAESIKQTNSGDLSANVYVAILKNPADEVTN
jgi:hypothetical protein